MSEHVNDCDCCQRKLAALRIAGTIDGIHLRQRDAYRDVLRDLITELRAQHYADQCECGCEQWYECEPCSHISLCPTQEAAVRAEARLRDVADE